MTANYSDTSADRSHPIARQCDCSEDRSHQAADWSNARPDAPFESSGQAILIADTLNSGADWLTVSARRSYIRVEQRYAGAARPNAGARSQHRF